MPIGLGGGQKSFKVTGDQNVEPSLVIFVQENMKFFFIHMYLPYEYSVDICICHIEYNKGVGFVLYHWSFNVIRDN